MKSGLKRRLQTGTALICSLAMAFSVLPVSAEESTQSLESKTSDLAGQLAGINQELVAISDQISTTEMQVEITNGEIQRTKDSLADAQAKEAQQYNDMKTRIKYMYETGSASLLEMLFSAEDMTDFLNKADFIQNISDYAQGSEYPMAILPMLPCFRWMLRRNIFYTAVTRARERFIIVGSKRAIAQAIRTDYISRRNTMFGYRIRKIYEAILEQEKSA